MRTTADRRPLAVLVLCAAATLAGSSSVEAWVLPPRVREARAWLQERMDARHFACLHALWSRESGWRVHARTGSAYGIPQALPGRKMRSAGRDWRTSAMTQVRWGLIHYIRPRYRGACAALRHSYVTGWY